MGTARTLALALALIACRRRDAPSPPAHSTHDTPPATTPTMGVEGAPSAPGDPPGTYRVVTVQRGATLTGHVRWQGPRPPAEAMAVPSHGDPAHCGTSQALDPLVVAADGGVQGAVLHLVDITRGVEGSREPVTVDQRQCRYVPRVVSVTVGAELRFTNNDPEVFHNVHGYYGATGDEGWFNEASPAGVTLSRRVQRAGVARLQCDSGHTWMLAWVHAFPHPYHAVSDATGAYVVRDVPPGVYRLRLWHEGWRRADVAGDPRPRFTGHVEQERPVTVNEGTTVTTDFTLGG